MGTAAVNHNSNGGGNSKKITRTATGKQQQRAMVCGHEQSTSEYGILLSTAKMNFRRRTRRAIGEKIRDPANNQIFKKRALGAQLAR